VYIAIMAIIAFLINIVALNVRSRRMEKQQGEKQRAFSKAKPGTRAPDRREGDCVIKCGNCGWEVRRTALSDRRALYGSPIRHCPHCDKDYIDAEYREIALEGVDAGESWFEAGNQPLEAAASRRRLSDSGYIHRLYQSAYAQRSPGNALALRKLAAQRVQPLIERLSASSELSYSAFRLRDADSLIDRLTYDAHDAAAVTRVVEDVLRHYGIDRATIRVQVDYIERHNAGEGGTLGTFTAMGAGGLVRIAIDPEYGEYDTVVAVVLHECAHAYLNARRIRIPDADENERLTDAAAIYLGGGDYILRGYFPPSGHRVGYLSKIECELAQQRVAELQASRAKRDAEARRQIEAEWSRASDELRALAASVENACRTLHPGRVLREQTIQARFHAQWQTGEAKLREAADALKRIGSGAELDNVALGKATDDARALAAPLREFAATLREWGEAEAYQMALPDGALETARGLGPLVEQGNAFAVLERLRFWYGCPATREDAELYYRRLLTGGDGASLCALGICSREGLCVPRDEAEARVYFQRAAALGSPDAQRLLKEG